MVFVAFMVCMAWFGGGGALPKAALCLRGFSAALPGMEGGLRIGSILGALGSWPWGALRFLLRGWVPPAVPVGLFQLPGKAWSCVLGLCCFSLAVAGGVLAF